MLCAVGGEEVDIQPHPDRLKNILEIDPPSNKQELMSFLGLVNTLRVWSPGIPVIHIPLGKYPRNTFCLIGARMNWMSSRQFRIYSK